MSPTDAKRLNATPAKPLCRGGLGDGRASSSRGGWGAARPQARFRSLIPNFRLPSLNRFTVQGGDESRSQHFFTGCIQPNWPNRGNSL